MTWYSNNKKKEQKRMKAYRSTVEFKKHRLEQDKKNRKHINELKIKWRHGVGKVKNKIQKKKDDAKRYAKLKDTPEFKLKESKRGKIYHENNKEKIAAYSKIHQQIPEIKARRNETSRIRRRNHPQSNRKGSIELQIAMNNVRIRDNQTCQWYNCGLTFKEVPIHVHHIFPVHEYPDYELIEKYMILYCANHHGVFHRYRGDKYANFIGANTEKLRSVG